MCGGTSLTACLGMTLAWRWQLRVLLIHAEQRGRGLEALLPKPEAASSIHYRTTPNGWSNLLRMLEHQQAEDDLLVPFTTPVMRNLDMLPGFDDEHERSTGRAKLRQWIQRIMRLAEKRYDIVLWTQAEKITIWRSLSGGGPMGRCSSPANSVLHWIPPSAIGVLPSPPIY